jgi:hypothetical protein
MDNSALIVLVVVVALAVVAGLYFYDRRRRLRQQFGPEYERAVREAGGTARAEAELAKRAKRVGKYDIRPLSPEDGLRFSTAWRQLQARFVDDPAGAVNEADRLVTDLMEKRGYPMADFDRRVEDLSVDHANVVTHYREAHHIVTSQPDPRRVSTEDLRQAVQHYRALFEDLLDIGGSPSRRPA